ncbi:hypothetical protein WR25_19052 [Diploscapter pachys]|uniref:guanylate cyclase n=1 Tax=Diploscapter pachys TaxID=2018661 RepID=A0A2A2JJX7_9BILA|nr:hypothetical protein WR25_19052 [Diploscapter pachys]
MIRKHGEELWLQVLLVFRGFKENILIVIILRQRAGFENGKENIVNHYYSDQDTYQLVESVAMITKLNREQVWEMYGQFLITYSMEIGWDELVRSVVKEVARRVFSLDISLTIAGRTQRSVHMSTGERIEAGEHVIFVIKNLNEDRRASEGSSDTSMVAAQFSTIDMDDTLRMTPIDFCIALPYHFIMDDNCRLVQAGKELFNHIPKELLQPETPILRIFEITRPQIPLDFDNICNFINAVFVLQVRTSPSDMRRQRENLEGPYVTSINELMQFGMRLTAMPMHDATRDLILLNQQRLTDVEVNLQLEANNEQLEAMAKDLEEEKNKTDVILKDMLPAQIANKLMEGEHIESCEYEEATVMFSDVPNFQQIVPVCQPKDVVHLLNELFTRLDRLVVLHKVYKVETVGDSYMTVGGIPDFTPEHAENIAHVALGMLWEGRAVKDPVSNKPLQLRIGMHSGPIVAGIVGTKMPRYCLFGDTVTTASRMETNGLAGKIHCSEKTYNCCLKTGRFEFVSRGRMMISGKGEMDTYFIIKSLKKSIWEICDRQRDVNLNSIEGYEELEAGLEGLVISQIDKPELRGVNNRSTACTIA